MTRRSLTVLPSGRRTTVGFINLGCTKNQVDAEIMLGALTSRGFHVTNDVEQAEVIIVNTCGFIEEAKRESIETILEYGALKKTGACKTLIAAGCLAQRYQDELLTELPELDAVVGTGEIGRIAEITERLTGDRSDAPHLWITPPPYLYDELSPRVRLGKSHSAYLKIAEGCNRRCAFCAIPLMRGKQRSRPVASIVEEAKRLAAEGVKELNLISQDTVNYGVDIGLRRGLVTLLRELVKVDGVRWIRPFYLYPQHVNDELINLYATEEKIAKYIDMPLQHISDRILKRMHRLGDRRFISRLVDRLRTRIPGLTFRTAFIVGFPGESDQDFRELRQYLIDTAFDRVAIFTYSDEEGTAAVGLRRKVHRDRAEARRSELLNLQEGIAQAKSREMIGTTLGVLVDGVSEESDLLLEGRHQGQAPDIDGVVYVSKLSDPGAATAGLTLIQPTERTQQRREAGETVSLPAPGTFVDVRIIDAGPYDLVGHTAG